MDRPVIVNGVAQEVRVLVLALSVAIPDLVLAPHETMSGG
jgi:hypothetical protein